MPPIEKGSDAQNERGGGRRGDWRRCVRERRTRSVRNQGGEFGEDYPTGESRPGHDDEVGAMCGCRGDLEYRCVVIPAVMPRVTADPRAREYGGCIVALSGGHAMMARHDS